MLRLLIAARVFQSVGGGIPKYVRAVARYAHMRGMQVLALLSAADPFIETDVPVGVFREPITDSTGIRPASIMRKMSFLKKTHASVVFIAHAEKVLFLNLAIAAKLLGIPVVGSHQGMIRTLPPRSSPRRRILGFARGVGWWWRRIALPRRILAECTALALFNNRSNVPLGVSEIGYTLEQCCVIHGGVDTERFRADPLLRQAARSHLGVGPDRRIVGSIGRFSSDKGQDILIRAFATSRQRRLGALLLMMGAGDQLDSCKRLCRDLELESQVVFLPVRPDVEFIMNALDLFVLPSRSESFSNSMLEAMACARPVVVSAVGGGPDIIVDGKNGLLFKPEDEDALAARIDLAFESGSGEAMGAAARRTVESGFREDAIMQRTVKAIRNAWGLRAAASPGLSLLRAWGTAAKIAMSVARDLLSPSFPATCPRSGSRSERRCEVTSARTTH